MRISAPEDSMRVLLSTQISIEAQGRAGVAARTARTDGKSEKHEKDLSHAQSLSK